MIIKWNNNKKKKKNNKKKTKKKKKKKRKSPLKFLKGTRWTNGHGRGFE